MQRLEPLRRYQQLLRCRIEVRKEPVNFGERSKYIVAGTNVYRQPRTHFPIVLDVRLDLREPVPALNHRAGLGIGIKVSEQSIREYAEELAAEMLATTLNVEFDPDLSWDEKKEVYRISNKIVRTMNVTQSAVGDKRGLWTTVLGAAILIGEDD